MKKILQISILVLLILVYVMVGLSYADTHTAESCSTAHVQAKIDEAARGDTVSVPAGTCTWTSRVLITKAIILIGAGSGEGGTTIINNDPTCTLEYGDVNSDCNINFGAHANWCGNGGGQGIITYIPSSSSDDENVIFSVSGFRFEQHADLYQVGMIKIINQSSTPLRKVMVYDNVFAMREDSSASWYSLQFNFHGYVWGVIYNNTINAKLPYSYFDGPELDTVDGGGCAQPKGIHTWKSMTFSLGSTDTMIVEDNTINIKYRASYPYMATGNGGNGYVLRYNTINNYTAGIGLAAGPQLHSAYVNNTAPKGLEIYGNYFYGYSTATFSPFLMLGRGGKLTAWNNLTQSAGTTNPGIELKHECDESLGNMATTHACPSDTLYNTALRCASDGQPPHVHNSYFFQNRHGTGTSLMTNVTANTTGGSTTVCGATYVQANVQPLVANQNYWKDNTSCTGTTCATGIGCGSTLPTCTGGCPAGVGFWLTTQSCSELTTDNVGAGGTPATKARIGTLYRRVNNQWVAYYTPAPYPHTLRDDVPADTTAPSISNLSPTAEQTCDDLDDTEDIALSLTAVDQTQASVTCYYDTETRANYAALAADGHEMTASGTTFSATAAGLACATTHTIWYACSDGTTATDVGTYQFTIAARGDSDAAVITNSTTVNQACATMQKISIGTDKPSTAKFCKAGETVGETVCDANTAYDDMPHTFSITGGETGHVAHSTDVSQSCSESVIYYIRTETTQGVQNSTSTAVTITTDAGKTVSIGAGSLTIGIGTGSNSIGIIQ